MFSLNYRGSWNQPPAQKETVKLLPQNMIHYFTPFWPNRRSNQSCGTTLGPGVTTHPLVLLKLAATSATLILKIHNYRYCWHRFDKFCDWWRWHPSSLKPASATPVLNLWWRAGQTIIVVGGSMFVLILATGGPAVVLKIITTEPQQQA